MGGDGGSIPKRDDLVKTRTKPEQVGKNAGMLTRWKHCALTQEPLRPPIVSCQMGRLFNKESLIEFLLDRFKFECAPKFSYIHSLKDVKELNLSENPAYTAEGRMSKCVGLVSPFICPVTGLEMNGRYRFCYLLGCGCVFAERAFKEVKDYICIKCGKSYTDDDIITMNGTVEEMAMLEARMDKRRLLCKSSKVSKKRKAAVETVAEKPVLSVTDCHSSDPTLDESIDTAQITTDKGGEKGAGISSAGQSKVARCEPSRNSEGSAPRRHGSASSSSSAAAAAAGAPSGLARDKKPKTIQDDPKASAVFKSLFNTHETARNQQHAHWVTYNPQYF